MTADDGGGRNGTGGRGMAVTRDGEGFVVEAAVLAQAFGLTEAGVRAAMADGRITSRCEAGIGEDAGRWRLTFRHGDRSLRLVVDAAGAILARSRITGAPRRAAGAAVPDQAGPDEIGPDEIGRGAAGA